MVAPSLSILFSKGEGAFRSPLNFFSPVGCCPTAVASGDFNGDGKVDLAAVNIDGVVILLNKGAGSFPTFARYGAGSEPGAIAVGDFNGDGKSDLAVMNRSKSVSILLGNGDGTFAAPVAYATSIYLGSAVLAADLNSDGKVDLIVVTAAGVSTLAGYGDGSFGVTANYPVGDSPASAVLGDFKATARVT